MGARALAWPDLRYASVPRTPEAHSLAAAVRSAVLPAGRRDRPLADYRAVARAGRLRISQETLSAAAGQEEALLIPLHGNAFSIAVDPAPKGGWSRIRPAVRADLRRHRHRFRVAHEIAHTFFYERGGARPRRLLRGSAEEEEFCDEFARALLLPVAAVRKRRPSPASVFSLHRDYDVSVEVAARAVAASRPGTQVALWHEHPRDGWLLQWSNLAPAAATRLRNRAEVDVTRGQAVAVHSTVR
jgi:hypothetical protein